MMHESSAEKLSFKGNLAKLPFSYLRSKRILDIVLCIAAIITLTPILIIISIAIKTTSSGPVLFKQERFGFNNEVFYILKFRTMRHDAPHTVAGRLIQATRLDTRVTTVGRILRATSLDELPQLFNVLAGDMSLVGPRPHAVNMIVDEEYYHELFSEYPLRHSVLPGLTGLAQIAGNRGAVTTKLQAYERLMYDLNYVERISLKLDIQIIIRTFFLIRHQAY